jgi:hypothetical protein
MGFVVKSSGSAFGIIWLAPAPAGSHTFGPRTYATVFSTQDEARAAADKASQSFGCLGMNFTVEAADS